uniref:NEK6-subfamily protein kinase n=1 Tax=Rousettus aegyptiacus TaxID=9407 RepID=A0A7J8BAI9_ROUAE|nr:NIMA related kinase 7 [Rousettus aegyptiacus]
MDEQSQGMPGPPAPQFQPQKALRPDMGYNTLANFRIEKKIGRGQFSEVYRAACLLDGVPVALKKVQDSYPQLCHRPPRRSLRTERPGARWPRPGPRHVSE